MCNSSDDGCERLEQMKQDRFDGEIYEGGDEDVEKNLRILQKEIRGTPDDPIIV